MNTEEKLTEIDVKKEGYSSLRWDITRIKERILCYKLIFNGDKEDFDAIVEFEPEFFAFFQIMLTENIVIRIGKLLDKRSDVISLDQFTKKYVIGTSQKDFDDKLEIIRGRANAIIRLRHEWLAHKNHDVAVGKKELAEVKISDLEEVIEMIGEHLGALRASVYPNGIIGEDGEEVIYVNNDQTKRYTKNLLEKIRKANSDTGI